MFNMNMFIALMILVLVTDTATAAKKPLDTIMDKLLLSSERFLSPLEKRSVPMDDQPVASTTCSDARIGELFSELNDSCQSFLFDATQYNFEEESNIMCESCGTTLYSILQCLDAGQTELELFNVLCTENENGDTCYRLVSGEGVEEDEIFAECGDMVCSDECRRKLQESFDEYGCCLYSLVALNGSEAAAHDMWDACDITGPGMCAPAFEEDSNESETPPTLPVDVEELPSDDEEKSVTNETPSSTTLPPNTEASRETSATTEASQPTTKTSIPTTTTTEGDKSSTTAATSNSESSNMPTAVSDRESEGTDAALLRGAANTPVVNFAVSLIVPLLVFIKL